MTCASAYEGHRLRIDRKRVIETINERPEALCQGWLARNAELEVLSVCWRHRESALAFEHASLSDEERSSIPYAKEFLELEREMKALSEQLEATLPLTVALSANTPEVLAAKLRIIQREVCSSEGRGSPEVRRRPTAPLRQGCWPKRTLASPSAMVAWEARLWIENTPLY